MLGADIVVAVMECPEDHVLVAMIEQALDPATMSALEVHFDSCEKCREVVGLAVGSAKRFAAGSSDPGVSATLPAHDRDAEGLLGSTIAERYKVLSLLGRGGMGTVYLARDAKLDRDVAIKVHRGGASADRLQREAVAMAQLAHPNVLNVFEVGTVDSWMYVVMEYVRGSTLRAWVAASPRPWRAVVALLIDAGTGLAAAHSVGLVHRDFKPDNVLVGIDERPRVSDFGLARVDHAGGVPLSPAMTLDTPLTVEGTVLGTPAYMPPEQLAGDPVDARGDQFAFAVVAWECLYGRRPFSGATLGVLQLAIDKHELDRPARTAVPARVGLVLERALSPKPEDRYPDVHALLQALRRAAAPRTKQGIAIAGAIALVALIAAFPVRATLGERRRGSACAEAASDVRSVLGLSARMAIQASFLASGGRAPQSSFDRMVVVLDRHVRALADQTAAACMARVEPARRSCLSDRTSELAGMVEVLEHADAKLVRAAPDVAWAMFDPTPCDEATFPPVSSTRTPQQSAQLGRAKALGNAGKYRESIAISTPLLEEARAHKDRGLELEVLIELGDARERIDPPAQVAGVFQQVLALAETLGRDYDATTALAALASLAEDQRDYAGAHRTIELARAKLARLGGSNPMFEGKLHLTEAQTLASEYRFPEAEAALRKAIAIMTPLVGADHPNVGSAYGTLAQILLAQHKGPEGLAASRQALQILQGALGQDHATAAGARMTVGQALLETGQLEEARTELLAADAVFARVFGPTHPIRSGIYGRIGRIEQGRQRWDAALAAFRTSLRIMERAEGGRSLEGAGARMDIAVTLAGKGSFDEAVVEARRSLAVVEEVAPDDLPRLRSNLMDLVSILLGAERNAEAIPVAERALAITTQLGDADDPDQLPAVQFALARALWDGKGDRARARLLADQALARQSDAATRTEIETWRAQHRR